MRLEIKVGIFALVGLVLFCLSVVLLGGDKWFLTRTYHLKVRMSQVQGLGRGSVVTLTGVSVGNIEDVNFIDKSNDVEVVLSIESAVQKRVTVGSKAIIKTQGALGDKFVFIEPGPVDAAPIPAGGELELDRTPDLFDVIASKGGEIGQITEVIKELQVLLKSLNHEGRPSRLMQNLVEGSAELKPTLADMRETLRMIKSDAVLPLASILRKIDQGQGTLGALINDPSLHNRISAFLGEAPRNRFLRPLIRESIQTNEKNK